MCKQNQQNTTHYNLIRTCMISLPLSAARVLYKCVLAVFVMAAKKSQKAASNVNADISTASGLSSFSYLQALETNGDQWERASRKSQDALHNLRCLDEATILGKLRAGIPRYATGGFDHAVDSIDTGEGHSGELLDFENASSHAGMALLPQQSLEEATIPPPLVIKDTEGVPTETMKPVNNLPSAPAVVMNYCGNF